MLLRIILFFALTVTSTTLPAKASEYTSLHCYANVFIENQENGIITGRLKGIWSDELVRSALCLKFTEKKIRITRHDGLGDAVLEHADSVALDILETGTAGENRVIVFRHFAIIKMQVDGQEIPKGLFPNVKVEIIEDAL